MPEFESLRFSAHALARMGQRRISELDVELTIKNGESWIEDDGNWICELGPYRVVLREENDVGVVITAMKLKGRDR